jgi:hypothetical protein
VRGEEEDGGRTLVQVVVFPAPCSPTSMMTDVVPFFICGRSCWSIQGPTGPSGSVSLPTTSVHRSRCPVFTLSHSHVCLHHTGSVHAHAWCLSDHATRVHTTDPSHVRTPSPPSPPLVSHSHQYPSISHSCPTHLMYALVPTPIHQSHQLVNDDLLYDPLAPVARGDVHALLALLVELDKLRQGAGFDALEEGLDEVDVDVGGEERGGDASEC